MKKHFAKDMKKEMSTKVYGLDLVILGNYGGYFVVGISSQAHSEF